MVPGKRPSEAGATFVVRRATIADVSALAAMRVASHGERYSGDPRRKDEFRAECEAFFTRELSQPDPFMRAWLAFERNDPARAIGTASLALTPTFPRLTEPKRDIDARVRNVYVEPGSRRRGVARMLMLELMAEVQRIGVRRITLGASAMGRPLYEALGFRQKADEMVYDLSV